MNSYQDTLLATTERMLKRVEEFRILRDAVTHAKNCLESCGNWDVETLSFNIECAYPEIDSDKCERIAAAVMRYKGLL